MSRLKLNNVSDFGGTNPLTFADDSTLTGTWTSAPPIPDLASGDYYCIVVNPDTTEEEIVYLLGPFTNGDTSSDNFLRGREGSTAAAASNAPWHIGATVFDFVPTYIGESSPEGVVYALFGETYIDAVGYDIPGSPGSTSGLYMFGRPNGDPVAAFAQGYTGPDIPLTVTMGSNDEFVWNDETLGSPETFTVAPGTYTTVDDLVAALNAAIGSTSAEAFDTIVTVTNVGGFPTFTLNTTGTAYNNSSLSPGANDITVEIGFPGNPGAGGYTFFEGGINLAQGWIQIGGANETTTVPGLQIDLVEGVATITAGFFWQELWSIVLNSDGTGGLTIPANTYFNGSLQLPFATISGGYYMDGNEAIVKGQSAAAIVLPPPEEGRIFIIYDAGNGDTTITPNGSESINGGGSGDPFDFTANQSILITSDNSGNWAFLATYTPAGAPLILPQEETAGPSLLFDGSTVALISGDCDLPALSSFTENVSVWVKNIDSISHTLTPNGSDDIDTVNAAITLTSMQSVQLLIDPFTPSWWIIGGYTP